MKEEKTLAFSRNLCYDNKTRTISSVGQSHRLIIGWSKVRALDGPPKNGFRAASGSVFSFSYIIKVSVMIKAPEERGAVVLRAVRSFRQGF